MFTKVSVLIPTRQRVDRLCTLLESYECTTSGAEESSELIFRVDEDDHTTRDFLAHYDYKVVVGPRLQGYQSLPTFFNEMFAVASGDVLMCGNDDIVFKTPHWAPLLLDAANQYPDGLVNLGVRTLNETHYPFCIVPKVAAERLGFYWDLRIFWGDIYWRDILAAFGRCVMVPSVHIEHDWAGWKPDRVFAESDKDITGRDPTYWSGTHATAVHEAVAKLRESA